MELRFAEPGDRLSIAALWDQCFPGDEDFRNYFLMNLFDPGNTLIYEDGGVVVSMAHMVPMKMNYHKHVMDAVYIYAVGTAPEHRGKGLAGDLMEQINFELHMRKIPVAFLVPQNEQLFAYYERFGYATAFRLSEEIIERANYPARGMPIQKCAPSEEEISQASSLYNLILRHRNHLMRSRVHWKTAAEIAEIAGGGMFCVKQNGELKGYAFCEWAESTLKVYEAFAENESAYHALLGGLLDRMKVDRAVMAAPACQHASKPFGMVRILDARGMLERAAQFRREMDCTFELLDDYAPWNEGRYEVKGQRVEKLPAQESPAAITASQFTEILFGAGPIPYMNLLYN